MILAQMPDYVSVKEAAAILNYHPESVRRLIRKGKLAADQKSNAWWILRESVEQFKAEVADQETRGRPKKGK